MRIAMTISMISGVAILAATPAATAPLPLSDHAAATLAAERTASPVETAGRRAKTRYTTRRVVRKCGWQCRPYWRPYQYRYWKFYYPFGGPLF